MNSAQCRMARAALNWTSRQLATVAGVPTISVHDMQAGQDIEASEVARLRSAFEDVGITFVEDDDEIGVRLQKKRQSGDHPKPVGPATDAIVRMDGDIAKDKAKRRQ